MLPPARAAAKAPVIVPLSGRLPHHDVTISNVGLGSHIPLGINWLTRTNTTESQGRTSTETELTAAANGPTPKKVPGCQPLSSGLTSTHCWSAVGSLPAQENVAIRSEFSAVHA